MQKKDNDFNAIKNILRFIAFAMFVGFVLKKLYHLIKKYDDDSFKWEDTVGEDIQNLINKYQKESAANPTATQEAAAASQSTPAPVAPKPKVQPKPVTPKTEVARDASVFDLNDRQEQIYSMIRDNGEITMGDIADAITDVSTRTLRRDMNKLEKLGLITHTGKTKDSVYKLKN